MKESDKQISKAVDTIKCAIIESQYQAIKGVNCMQLSLYYGIGQYVADNSRKGFWGTGAIERISELLQQQMPGLRGFGAANIKFMRQFYEAWRDFFTSLTTVSEFDGEKTLTTVSEINAYQLLAIKDVKAEGFPADAFLSIGFTHHMIIIRGTESLEERMFYIQQAAVCHWNKNILSSQIKSDAYNHRGALANNFEETLTPMSALNAISIFKDEYFLDYINTEELGVRDMADVDERVLEQGIVHNIKNFIMTFGRGFSFIGNQFRLSVGGEDYYVDLLFYNRELQSLVAIELKTGNFKPQYLGQLKFYLQALDDQVRLPNENPSIGLVLCQEVNKVVAEYAVRDYDKPMGVATYRTAADMPERLRNALPSPEELKQLLAEHIE